MINYLSALKVFECDTQAHSDIEECANRLLWDQHAFSVVENVIIRHLGTTHISISLELAYDHKNRSALSEKSLCNFLIT